MFGKNMDNPNNIKKTAKVTKYTKNIYLARGNERQIFP